MKVSPESPQVRWEQLFENEFREPNRTELEFVRERLPEEWLKFKKQLLSADDLFYSNQGSVSLYIRDHERLQKGIAQAYQMQHQRNRRGVSQQFELGLFPILLIGVSIFAPFFKISPTITATIAGLGCFIYGVHVAQNYRRSNPEAVIDILNERERRYDKWVRIIQKLGVCESAVTEMMLWEFFEYVKKQKFKPDFVKPKALSSIVSASPEGAPVPVPVMDKTPIKK